MYSAKTQYAATDTVELLNAQSTLYVQKVCGNFLYHAIAVDQTMLVALNTITTAQAHVATAPMGDIVWLLKYTAKHTYSTLYYHSSDMILNVASNASYNYEERARSRTGDLFRR